MTDDDLSPAETATATELRRSFAAVATATPTVDRRADLLAELDAAERRSGAARGARLSRLVPIAAALLLVGAAVVALALRADDDPTERAGPGTRDDASAGPFDDPALETGWYLPPEGWTIATVEDDYLDVGEAAGCPCIGWSAARPGDDPAVIDGTETDVPSADGLPPDETTTPIDIGGRTGRSIVRPPEAPEQLAVWVETSDRQVTVTGRGVEVDDLVVVADAWADAVEAGHAVESADLPVPDGFATTPVARRDGRFEHLLAITAVEGATGRQVEYQLVPTGFSRSNIRLADTVDAGAGALLYVLEADDGGVEAGAVGGPVDITVGIPFFGARPTALDRGELVAFRDGLREVDTEEWRSALPDGGDVPDEVRSAPTLFDPPLTG